MILNIEDWCFMSMCAYKKTHTQSMLLDWVEPLALRGGVRQFAGYQSIMVLGEVGYLRRRRSMTTPPKTNTVKEQWPRRNAAKVSLRFVDRLEAPEALSPLPIIGLFCVTGTLGNLRLRIGATDSNQ